MLTESLHNGQVGLPSMLGAHAHDKIFVLSSPIPGVFEIVRLCDGFESQAPEFHQLADVQIIMRDPTGEHLSGADGTVRSGIGYLPIRIL
jgi:hypothetical protein